MPRHNRQLPGLTLWTTALVCLGHLSTASAAFDTASYFPVTNGSFRTYQDIATGAIETETVTSDSFVLNGIVTSVIEFSATSGKVVVSNDANGVRMHQLSDSIPDPSLGTVDYTVSFTPPLTILPVQAGIGQTLNETGSVSLVFPGLGAFAGPYSGTYSNTVAIEGREQFGPATLGGLYDTIRTVRQLTMAINVAGSPLNLAIQSTDLLTQGIGSVRNTTVEDGVTTTEELVATNLSAQVGVREDEPNESTGLATAGTADTGSIFGRLTNNADVDFYVFNLAPGEFSVRVKAFSPQPGTADTNRVQIRDAAGNILDSKIIDGSSSSFTDLATTIVAAGSYYLVISAESSVQFFTHDYELIPHATTASAPAYSKDLVIDFGPGANNGLWTWESNGAGNNFHPFSSEQLLLADLDNNGIDDLVIDFGPGIGIFIRYNNVNNYTQIHQRSPLAMSVADMDNNGTPDIVINFGPGIGLYAWMNNNNYQFIHGVAPQSFAIADVDGNGQDDVVVNFGPGIGQYVRLNNSSWGFIHGLPNEDMVITDLDSNGADDIVIDFGPGIGLWARMNNSSWQFIHGLSPLSMTAADLDTVPADDLVIDFGPGIGLWRRMNSTNWLKANANSPQGMTVIDFDGNGIDDVVLDFGPGIGLYTLLNNSSLQLLSINSPETMLVADLDNNGQPDLIGDFGNPIGLWSRTNNAFWQQIDSRSPQAIAAGKLN